MSRHFTIWLKAICHVYKKGFTSDCPYIVHNTLTHTHTKHTHRHTYPDSGVNHHWTGFQFSRRLDRQPNSDIFFHKIVYDQSDQLWERSDMIGQNTNLWKKDQDWDACLNIGNFTLAILHRRKDTDQVKNQDEKMMFFFKNLKKGKSAVANYIFGLINEWFLKNKMYKCLHQNPKSKLLLQCL